MDGMRPEQLTSSSRDVGRPAEDQSQSGRSLTEWVDMLENLSQELSGRGALQDGGRYPEVQAPPLAKLNKYLNTAANLFRDMFKQNGSIESLENAIRLLQIELQARSHGSDRSACLNDLAGALWEKYKRSGNLADLNKSIEALEDALAICTLGHPLRAETLSNLAICLQDKSRETHSHTDLDQAIETQKAALALRPEGHPDRSSSLTNLALCLRHRYKERSSVNDLEGAVAYSRAALGLRPEGHHLRPSCLSNLAIALQDRYELHGVAEDLRESIQFLRAALACYPLNHSERPAMQFNLSISIGYNFRQDGSIADLNEAIDLLRPLEKRGSLQHNLWIMCISTLGNNLKERFWHLGASIDLDEAIMYHAIAVEVCSHKRSERSTFLNNLGNSFDTRFLFKGSPRDLEKAIENHQAALALRPLGHSDRPSSLNNLGRCYKQRFEHTGVVDDLTKAIDCHRTALELYPEDNVRRPSSLANLASCLMSLFAKHGVASDLTEAVELFRVTLSLRPVGHSDRTQSLGNLALALQNRFEHLRSADDLNESFRLFSELSELKKGVSRWDLKAAGSWAASADKYGHSSAMIAYQTALNFLVCHAAIFPSAVEHYWFLKNNVSSLAVDAFSYCLRQGDTRTALELLEQGRAVFWTQLAHLGSPLDELSSLGTHGENLANKFKRIGSRLRTLFDQVSILQEEHWQTWKLTDELDEVVSLIRTLPGFSRFLLPPEFSDFQTAARDGPVIVMNASQYTCDAVIVLRDKDLVHVRLKTSKDDVSKLAGQFRRVVDEPKLFSTKIIGTILRNVWDCAVEPVVQALQQLDIPFNSRIWWCPTSDFTFLPLHATGPFRKGQPQLSDLYISSYTPTLGALLSARKQARGVPGNPPFAVVGTSKAAGVAQLPSVTSELALVVELVRDYSSVTLLADEDATVQRATDAFRRCKWLHLACHGIPKKARPFESSFALQNGRLTLGKLIQSADFENRPDFAFLSACRTTVGDVTTPDEAINLAAAMQFAGFKSVIGTVLPVDDAVAGKVVSAFYTNLLSDSSSSLDCTRAAVALHRAMKSLRGKISFDQQIVFVHIGI